MRGVAVALACSWLIAFGCEPKGPCHEDAAPCPLQSPEQCLEGCAWSEVCVVFPCASLKKQVTQCEAIPACRFDEVTGCSQGSDPCAVHATPEACSADPSCVAGPGCTGVPTNCLLYEDNDSCEAAPGCVWGYELP